MKTKPNYLRLFNFLKYHLNYKSYSELARNLGLSKSFLSEILNNKKGLSIERLFKIAEITNFETDLLFTKLVRKGDL